MSEDNLEYIVLMGVELCVDRNVISAKTIEAFSRGDYEVQEARQVLALLQPGEIVLELGAGCGFISTLAAKNLPRGEVHAIEGNPDLIPLITSTYRRNGVSVTLRNCLVGRDRGKSAFYLAEEFVSSTVFGNGKQSITLDVEPIQEILDDIRPTMLICDVEGMERDLFVDTDLSSIAKIVVEVHPEIIGNEGVLKVFTALADNGFVYDADISCGRVVSFRRFRQQSSATKNRNDP